MRRVNIPLFQGRKRREFSFVETYLLYLLAQRVSMIPTAKSVNKLINLERDTCPPAIEICLNQPMICYSNKRASSHTLCNRLDANMTALSLVYSILFLLLSLRLFPEKPKASSLLLLSFQLLFLSFPSAK